MQTPCSKTANEDGDELEARICNRIIPEIANAIKDGFLSLASVFGGPKKDVEVMDTLPTKRGPSALPTRINATKSHSAGRSTSAVKLDFVDLSNEGIF